MYIDSVVCHPVVNLYVCWISNTVWVKYLPEISIGHNTQSIWRTIGPFYWTIGQRFLERLLELTHSKPSKEYYVPRFAGWICRGSCLNINVHFFINPDNEGTTINKFAMIQVMAIISVSRSAWNFPVKLYINVIGDAKTRKISRVSTLHIDTKLHKIRHKVASRYVFADKDWAMVRDRVSCIQTVNNWFLQKKCQIAPHCIETL